MITERFSTRIVEDGYETVTIKYESEWKFVIQALEQLSTQSRFEALAELCSYPRVEWRRIESYKMIDEEVGFTLEVKFRNPGKQFEEFLALLASRAMTFEFDIIGFINDGLTLDALTESTHISEDALKWVTSTSGNNK